MMLGATACGPMPGYQMPRDEAPPTTPRAPPAPRPTVAADPRPERVPTRRDAVTPTDDGEDRSWEEVEDEAPEEEDKPAPRPPRYTPPRNWDGPEAPARKTRPADEPAPEPDKGDGIRIVRLDADSYYLIDSLRKLCFLRHKESMTAIDCAKIPEANEVTRSPGAATPEPRAPTRMPEPARMPEPTRMPEPEPVKRDATPTAPSPDEMLRFESAFIDIYCDRKVGDETTPEARIRERGLTTTRYEAIEAWWANDENAWYTLTTRASKGCADDR